MTALIEPGLTLPVDEFDAIVASAGGPDVASDPIPFQASPPSVSLISAAVDVTAALRAAGGGDHWLNGVKVEPEGGVPSLTADFPYWWVCPESGGDTAAARSPSGVKQVQDAPTVRTFRPITAHTADPCFTAGGRQGARGGPDRARRLIEANLPRLVEHEFWTSARALMAAFPNPGLARTAGTALNGGAATPFLTALSLLEDAIGDLGNEDGFIHATRRVVNLWVSEGCVWPDATGRRLKTRFGTTVVPGVGYPGTGPSQQAETVGISWAYATGPVVYARTEARVNTEPSRVDRSINDMVNRGEIDFVVMWDGKYDAPIQINTASRL